MPTHSSEASVSADEVRIQLDRILESRVFSRSRRQMVFLSFVVNAALEGQEEELKEFVLGVEVFEKDASFDPGTDSIVRVEAGRLRAKLREYYAEEGVDDPVKIEIPKGHYAPEFSRLLGTGDSPKLSTKLRIGLLGVAALLVIGGVYIGYEIQWGGSVPPEKSQQLPFSSRVAVLPLRDLSRAPERHFSDAITDGLISALADEGALRVTALASVLKFNSSSSSVSEIGRMLDVDHVIDGTLLRDGERVQVTAQLFNVDAGKQIWSTNLERSVAEMPSTQREIASAIALQVSDGLSPSPTPNVINPNPAAYEAYMKGRYFYNQFTSDGFLRSMVLFQEALEIEPNYAEAYAGLASCHCLLAGHGLEMVSPIVAIPQAQSHALTALSLNGALAEPHAFLGIISFKFAWDLESAIAKIEHALRLKPSLYQAYVWHSQILEAMGQHDAAVERAREAKQLNPLSLAASLNLGWQLYQAGKYIEADKEIDGLIRFSPRFWGGHWVKGSIYVRHRMYAKAIEEFQKAVDLDGGHSLPMSALGYTYGIAGQYDDARKILVELDTLSQETYVSPFHVAMIYAGLKEPDLMFEWLERAYEVRARSLAWLQVTHELEPFHNDARYLSLLGRIGMFSNTTVNPGAGVDL